MTVSLRSNSRLSRLEASFFVLEILSNVVYGSRRILVILNS